MSQVNELPPHIQLLLQKAVESDGDLLSLLRRNPVFNDYDDLILKKGIDDARRVVLPVDTDFTKRDYFLASKLDCDTLTVLSVDAVDTTEANNNIYDSAYKYLKARKKELNGSFCAIEEADKIMDEAIFMQAVALRSKTLSELRGDEVLAHAAAIGRNSKSLMDLQALIERRRLKSAPSLDVSEFNDLNLDE